MNRYFGDKRFYKMALIIVLPIIVQNGITNFVSMLDNLMVGQMGTEEMSGVAIANQIIFVFNISVFGGVSGPGIFSAQYYGNNDLDGLRNTFRYKVWICALITVIGIAVVSLFGTQLISLWLHGSGSSGDVEQVLKYGTEYLAIMEISFIFFAISQIYSGTLKETGQTIVPMTAGIIAVAVNLILDYILIFGKLGMPELGVRGAAIATVIARVVECMINVVWLHRHKFKYQYISGVYRTLIVPRDLVAKITKKGTPLMLNEMMWAAGTAVITQCYALRGIQAVAALNISTVISNVFSVVVFSFGSGIAIIIGQLLGAGKFEEARDTDRKLITFTLLICIAIAFIMILFSGMFPEMYNTDDEIKNLAAKLIVVTAMVLPIQAFANAAYFTIRSGGRTMITFLFDSAFVWLLMIPLAYILGNYTDLPLVQLYLIVQGTEIIKCIIAFIMLKRGVWIKNIVHEPV